MRAPARLRNFGIIAHIDAGKTTVSERMLFVSGHSHSIGETHHGTSKLDHQKQERDRGITIGAAATTIRWAEHQLNLIDTPGHVDFTVEVERSLRVLDGAVAVFDAVAGVEPQSETVWRQADRHGVPRIVFINKMDRDGADPVRAVPSIEQRLGATTVVTQLPIGIGDSFLGVVDLVHGVLWKWNSNDPEDVDPTHDLPGALALDVAAARTALWEQLAELDETFLDAWHDDAVTADDAIAAIRRLTIAGEITPVLFGAALAGIGTQPLLDAIVDWLPGPGDCATDQAPTDATAPASALAFKVQYSTGSRIVWTRVHSGVIARGDKLRNSTTGREERIGRLVQLDAGRTTDVEQATAGDIVAVIGLKQTTTGDTLCDPAAPVVLETMDFPDPVMSVVIEPTTTGDQDRLATALNRLTDQDPTLSVRTDPDTGETLLAGMGELHLQVRITELRDDHGIDLAVGEPTVALRETITTPVEQWRFRLSKQTGGPGMFAEVAVDIEPSGDTEPASLDFVDETKGGAVPTAYAKAFADGFREAMSAGPVEGHPLVGVRVTLTDGATHPNDSSEQAFRMAGAIVCREATQHADPIVLEPIMAVTITTPEDFLGPVMGLIGAKRGRAGELAESHGDMELTALVPLAELFGFVGDLRSVSQGRAGAAMQLHGYEPQPS